MEIFKLVVTSVLLLLTPIQRLIHPLKELEISSKHVNDFFRRNTK
jgi:hypothetical protein